MRGSLLSAAGSKTPPRQRPRRSTKGSKVADVSKPNLTQYLFYATPKLLKCATPPPSHSRARVGNCSPPRRGPAHTQKEGAREQATHTHPKPPNTFKMLGLHNNNVWATRWWSRHNNGRVVILTYLYGLPSLKHMRACCSDHIHFELHTTTNSYSSTVVGLKGSFWNGGVNRIGGPGGAPHKAVFFYQLHTLHQTSAEPK